MPEGDTVYRQAVLLRRALAGRILTRSDLRFPSIATADLSGRTVTEVVPRGKHLLVRTDGGPDGLPPLTLHSHLLMEGMWHVYPRGARWRRPAYRPRVSPRMRLQSASVVTARVREPADAGVEPNSPLIV